MEKADDQGNYYLENDTGKIIPLVDLIEGIVPPSVPIGTRSQSFRYGTTTPYVAPSEAVIPQDYNSSAGNGSYDISADMVVMVADAKAAGTQRTGTPILFVRGRYRTSEPIVLPRSGVTPSTIVPLIGMSARTSIIEALSGFPTNRALIEWEASTSQAWHQRISGLMLKLPGVAGTKAIWHKKNGVGSAVSDYSAEWLQCDMEDLLIEADNRYHEVLIDLEIGNRRALMRNISGDPARSEDGSSVHGTYDTLLLRAASTRGGTDPAYIDEDGVGIGFCTLENLQPMVRRGGWCKAFEGRIYESSWDGCFANGGHFSRGANFNFINSGLVDLANLRTEGKGESSQFAFTKCQQIDLTNCGPVVPTAPYTAWVLSHAYVVGDLVVPKALSSSTAAISKKYFTCTVAGTSAASEPTWPTVDGNTVTDGGVTWSAVGDAIGDGVTMVNSQSVRWHGRFARNGAVAFSNRLVKALTMDSNCARNAFDDWDVNEVTAGSAAAEFTVSAADTAQNQIMGRGVSGSNVNTPYVVGWNRQRPVDLKAVSKTTTATLSISERRVDADATSGAFTITLPAPTTLEGVRFTIIRKSSAANNVTVAPPSGTISGAATKTLGSQFASITVESDGTRWLVIASFGTVT